MVPRFLEATPAAGVRPRGTLVLLHAFPLNARMWEPQLSMADHGWHVIAPQFRGFDGGAGDPPASSVDDYAGDVIDLLDARHIQDAVVCGLSLGGYISFALLRLAASYVRALVLADTRPQGDPPEGVEGRKKMLALLDSQGTAAIAAEMLPKLLGATTMASRQAVVDHVRALIVSNGDQAIAGAIRALMTRPDSTPLLPSIHVPTLIIVGEEDTLTPPAMSEAMHKSIGGSILERIPAAGHLSNLEQPRTFSALLADFLTHRV